MKKVLILIPYYKPGYRSGGPQRTIENVCCAYKDKAEIYIATQNFDLGEINNPYEVETEKWCDVDGVKVMYFNHKMYNFKGLKTLFKNFDIIYSCGLFEINSLSLLLLNRVYRRKNQKIYIAPMGVFSPGAFRNKYKKKKTFIQFIKSLGLYKNIIWSLTSDTELKEAISVFGNRKYIENYLIAEDLPSVTDFDRRVNVIEKVTPSEALRVIFLSRICPKKNLLFAIEILKEVQSKSQIIFDIYGVPEDLDYWSSCQKEIKNISNNLLVNYKGMLKPELVIDTFSNYDIFLFPTKGENFGHVIYEALAAGCIPVISNQTPWLDFEEFKCGNVIEINNKNGFIRAIENYDEIDRKELEKIKKSCISYAKEKYKNSVLNSGYNKIFI